MSRESIVQSQIMLYWGSHPRVRLERTNVYGRLFVQHGDGQFRHVRAGVAGKTDISGLVSLDCNSRWWERLLVASPWRPLIANRVAVALAIECKSDIGELSEEQSNYRTMILTFGGIWMYARVLEDVNRVLIPLVGAPPK